MPLWICRRGHVSSSVFVFKTGQEFGSSLSPSILLTNFTVQVVESVGSCKKVHDFDLFGLPLFLDLLKLSLLPI